MTIRITRIFSAGSGNVISVETEISQGDEGQKETFNILASQYSAMSPCVGEITREQYDELYEASKLCLAYLRGMNILSFGANTEKTLIMKLRRRGIEETYAREAVEMLKLRGYINDDEELIREVERCLRKLWGARRILAHLRQRGYEEEAISAAEDRFSKVDFNELCLSLAEKKFEKLPEDIKERQKMVAFFIRYGYAMSEIKYAMSRLDK